MLSLRNPLSGRCCLGDGRGSNGESVRRVNWLFAIVIGGGLDNGSRTYQCPPLARPLRDHFALMMPHTMSTPSRMELIGWPWERAYLTRPALLAQVRDCGANGC